MDSNHKLNRFLEAQNQVYLKALSEIRNGRKQSHWMWFIFPQIQGLGLSDTAKFYAISDLEEATMYLAHPVLGKHLIEITSEACRIKGKTATEIFGQPDDVKFRSCLTLFANVIDTHPIFEEALLKYFDGYQDELTLKLLLKNKFHNDTV